MWNSSATLTLLLLMLTILYLVYWYSVNYWFFVASPGRDHCGSGPPPSRGYAGEEEGEEEYFMSDDTNRINPQTGTPEQLQRAINFSDVTVTEEQRREQSMAAADVDQIQTVNERFEASKRKTLQHKVRVGVYTNEQRRKLVETLLRRPHCGRRVRSWRTENSDFLRGDVRPKPQRGTNLIRSAKSNPEVDLHPGALGPMSGLSGLWLSEENLPGNLAPEPVVYG